MTKEERQLLLVDLAARLPYKCKYKASNGITHWHRLTLSMVTIDKIINGFYDEIKPYLRPLSSMTEEEKKEFQAFHCIYELHPDFQPIMCNLANELNMFNWLNKKMFDYRELIPIGLALEAPEGMY